MRSISVLIAWRYIYEANKIKTISTMVKICFFSIFIGTFALTLSLCIMTGFEKATHEKMQNIHYQITIQAKNNYLNYEQIKKVLDKEFPEIKSHSATDTQYAIIKSDYTNDISNVIAIRAIDPINESKVNNIASKIIVKSDKKFEDLLIGNKVIIGDKLAKELDVTIGNEITLLIAQKFDRSNLKFEEQNVFISAIFKTGIDDFDSKVIFASLDFDKDVFINSGISEIGIKLNENKDETDVINKLKNRFKLNVFSWKDLYPSLVSTLKLEKYVIFFIFSLISIISGINIISLLFMIINYKRRDLMILKSSGLSNFEIQKIFILLGLIITISANIAGLFSAFIVGSILQRFQFIQLPDTYYSDHLPIDLNIKIFIMIFIFVNIIGLLASLLPTKRILSSNISVTLKNEN